MLCGVEMVSPAYSKNDWHARWVNNHNWSVITPVRIIKRRNGIITSQPWTGPYLRILWHKRMGQPCLMNNNIVYTRCPITRDLVDLLCLHQYNVSSKTLVDYNSKHQYAIVSSKRKRGGINSCNNYICNWLKTVDPMVSKCIIFFRHPFQCCLKVCSW